MKAVPKFLELYHMQVEQVKMMRILSYLHFSLCQWQVRCSIDDAAVSLCTMAGESKNPEKAFCTHGNVLRAAGY